MHEISLSQIDRRFSLRVAGAIYVWRIALQGPDAGAARARDEQAVTEEETAARLAQEVRQHKEELLKHRRELAAKAQEIAALQQQSASGSGAARERSRSPRFLNA